MSINNASSSPIQQIIPAENPSDKNSVSDKLKELACDVSDSATNAITEQAKDVVEQSLNKSKKLWTYKLDVKLTPKSNIRIAAVPISIVVAQVLIDGINSAVQGKIHEMIKGASLPNNIPFPRQRRCAVFKLPIPVRQEESNPKAKAKGLNPEIKKQIRDMERKENIGSRSTGEAVTERQIPEQKVLTPQEQWVAEQKKIRAFDASIQKLLHEISVRKQKGSHRNQPNSSSSSEDIYTSIRKMIRETVRSFPITAENQLKLTQKLFTNIQIKNNK
ncbi:MAG: hypothetical protein QRY74_04155 [Chlamydia sp.]